MRKYYETFYSKIHYILARLFHSLLVFRCLLSSQQSVSLGPRKPSFYSTGPSPRLYYFHLFRFLTETCLKPYEKVRVLESILSKGVFMHHSVSSVHHWLLDALSSVDVPLGLTNHSPFAVGRFQSL